MYKKGGVDKCYSFHFVQSQYEERCRGTTPSPLRGRGMKSPTLDEGFWAGRFQPAGSMQAELYRPGTV